MRSYIEWLDKKGFYVRSTWDDEHQMMAGKGKLSLFPHQRMILGKALSMNERGLLKYETVTYSCPKKSGKALALDTPIPTKDGWSKMGALQVGDSVFDGDGNVVAVTFTSPIMYGHECYRVCFSDGTYIVADAEHVWSVLKRNGGGIGDGTLVTTRDMHDSGVMRGASGTRRYSIRTDSPLALNNVALPIDPYLLGAWLGDGSSCASIITCGDNELDEMFSLLSNRNFPARVVYHKNRSPGISFGGDRRGKRASTFMGTIRLLGLRGNKHIPIEYLRSSIEQRKELLRGLMDTDGYISKGGRCEFTSMSFGIINQFKELLRSLGIKGNITDGDAILNGVVVGTKYRIHFTPDFGCFKLTRKLEHQVDKGETARSRFVRVVDIFPMESVPVRCIQVDSSSHLFLAGLGMIPTHNTSLNASVGAWYAEESDPGTEIFCIANDLEQAEGRVMKDIKFHVQQRILNEDLFDLGNGDCVVMTEKNCKITAYKIEFPNETFIQALAQSYRSVAGSRHALTLWDELWGVTNELSRRTWDEMTPIPTVTNSLRFISTYAGFENESDLLWDLYLRGVGEDEREGGRGKRVKELNPYPCWENGKLFTYWDTESRMPWQTDEYYYEQQQSERPAAFLRLHRNQWVTSQEEFIPIEWLNFAFKQYEANANLWTGHPFREFPVTIGIDAGQKRDCTALVAVGFDSKRAKVGIVSHKIWEPQPGDPIDLDETVEKELLEMYNKFKVVSIVYDPALLVQTMIRLKRKGLPVREFTQSIGNMTAASQLLFDLFKNRNMEGYPSEDLYSHLRMAVAETSSRGFRIVKSKVSRRQKVDGAIALAIACYDAVQNGGVDTSIPIRIASPWPDKTAWGEVDQSQRDIPFPLRS